MRIAYTRTHTADGVQVQTEYTYRLKRENVYLFGLLLLFLLAAFLEHALPEDVPTSDGRYAECGVITEEGVTEHLETYAQRCTAQN